MTTPSKKTTAPKKAATKGAGKPTAKAPAKRAKAAEPAAKTSSEGAEPAAAQTATAKKARKAPKPREINTDTPAYRVRKLCLEHPDAPVGEIETLANAQGATIHPNTIRGLYQGSMGLLRVARHLGYAITKA